MTGLSSRTETVGVVEVTDKVRDLMVMTVPRLAQDELEPMVEPDPLIPDDGCAKLFAKLFIYDDMPRMAVSDEVRDLMFLAEPSVAELAAELAADGAEILVEYGDDGLEAVWALDLLPDTWEVPAEEAPVEIPEVPYDVPEEACQAFAALMATGSGFAAPEPVRPSVPEVPYEVPEEACQAFAALMATGSGFEPQPDWGSMAGLACSLDRVEDIRPGEPDDAFDLPAEIPDVWTCYEATAVPVPEAVPDAAPVEAPVSEAVEARVAEVASVPVAEVASIVPAVEVASIAAPVSDVRSIAAPVSVVASIAPAIAVLSIGASEAAMMIGAPKPAASLQAPGASAGLPQASAAPEAAEVPEIAEEALGKAPLVTFSFGPQGVAGGGRRVVFSF